MQILIELDAHLKSIVENLFWASAQIPQLAIEGGTLNEDSLAIFRIAKEFALSQAFEERRPVEVEDVARTLRFICWFLSYGGNPILSSGTERAQKLRQLFASFVLQGQAQYPGFEALLRAIGVERQLGLNDSSTDHRRSSKTSASATQIQTAALNLERVDRTQKTEVRIGHAGIELTQTTNESTWIAEAWKQNAKPTYN